MRDMLMIVFNDLNTDARVTRAAEALSPKYNITVFSSQKNYITNANFKNVVSISNSKSTLIRYVVFIINLLKMSFKGKYSLVYAHDFYSALPLLILRLFNRDMTMIYDAHELYIPEDSVSFSMRDKFFYKFEAKVINESGLVICAQEDRARIMKEHYNLIEMPLVIRNISILSKDKKSNIIIEHEEFFKKEGVSVVYAGSLSVERKIENLVDAVNELGENFKLLIVGNGSGKKELEKRIKEYNNDRILMVNSVPYESLGSLLSLFDIGYVYYSNDRLNDIYCASNKIYEYASVKLPMISYYNPTIEKIFLNYEIGKSGEDLKELLIDMRSRIPIPNEKFEYFLKENSWVDESKKLLEAVENLVSEDMHV